MDQYNKCVPCLAIMSSMKGLLCQRLTISRVQKIFISHRIACTERIIKSRMENFVYLKFLRISGCMQMFVRDKVCLAKKFEHFRYELLPYEILGHKLDLFQFFCLCELLTLQTLYPMYFIFTYGTSGKPTSLTFFLLHSELLTLQT